MFLKYIVSPFLLFLLLIQNVFAVGVIGSIPQVINDSIYILELVVIAVVAIALIVLTLSIARSRRRISDMVSDIRNEMNEERTVFAMTVKSIKEKEKQVSYMAHLLQSHLENDDASNVSKKKPSAMR
jgi:Sec-independent protein translocase protein TatA